MCGFTVTNVVLDENNIEEINKFSKARGPDATNHLYDQETGIHWIHNLLHITGEKTVQPFIEKSDLILAFNGEIYNYKEFDSTASSDGYCIGTAYLCAELHKLDGEFAIVINDKRKKKDRSGK